MPSRKAITFFLIGLVVGLIAGYLITSNLCGTRVKEKEFSMIQEQAILGAYFSPKDSCSSKLIYWFNRANKSIHVMIYSFTLDSVSDALIKAHKKGIKVLVIMEKNQVDEYSEYEKLKNAGISVRLDSNQALMHNKVAIIDGKIVITGSYNWSRNAEYENNENMIIILSTEVSQVYEKEFQRIWIEGK
ncbi:MAG: phospholipase D family protein [Candidatus Bathyarchaeia archaeon]